MCKSEFLPFQVHARRTTGSGAPKEAKDFFMPAPDRYTNPLLIVPRLGDEQPLEEPAIGGKQ